MQVGANVLRFKHFARKAYAAFVSMHREVTIGRLSRALCDRELVCSGRAFLGGLAMSFAGVMSALASVADSSAIPDEVAQLRLQEVQVISQQTEIHSQAYRLVTQISSEVIATLPATTVADLLQTLPGLDIRTRGASGVQADARRHLRPSDDHAQWRVRQRRADRALCDEHPYPSLGHRTYRGA